MENGTTIVPEFGEGKWAESLPDNTEGSGSWIAKLSDSDDADIAPKADMGSLERYKNEIDGEISKLDSRISELEKRRDALTEKLKGMARYSTDREIAANRLEAGEGAGEYDAMRGRMVSDATKEQQEAKAASDKEIVDRIDNYNKKSAIISTLNTDAKNLKDSRTTVVGQNNSTTPSEKANNESALQYYTDQMDNDIKDAVKLGMKQDELDQYINLLNANPLDKGKTPEENSATGSDTPSGESNFTMETVNNAITESKNKVQDGAPKASQEAERARLKELLGSVNASGMSDDDKKKAANLINARIYEIIKYKTKEVIAAAAAAGNKQAAAEKKQAAADIAAWKAAMGNPSNYSSLSEKLSTFLKSKKWQNEAKYYDISIGKSGNLIVVEN